MMIPPHWNFPEPQSRSFREQKQLHVKAKSDDFRGFDNWSTRFHPKRFEAALCVPKRQTSRDRSEEHTSELQSRFDLVCRLLLEKKNRHGFGRAEQQLAV